jgi:hypothetical protein
MGERSWMWTPALLTLVLGVELDWAIFKKKECGAVTQFPLKPPTNQIRLQQNKTKSNCASYPIIHDTEDARNGQRPRMRHGG